MKKLIIICVYLTFSLQSSISFSQNPLFDVEGHRGCRGYMPENSIPGFIEAVKMNVTTLELDVVISRDKKVIVSHEPWISQSICLNSDGSSLKIIREDSLNIFQMEYIEVKNYDCGSLLNDLFPDQQKIKTHKPLLSEVFDTVILYCKSTNRSIPEFNIEIKSDFKYDAVYSPPVNEFCDLVISEIAKKSLETNCIIQSFDVRALKYIHEKYPYILLSFLTEELTDINEISKLLGFTPNIYSPDKGLVSKDLISSFHSKNVKIIPWTVNEIEQMRKFIRLGVDGIISDYPDRVLKALN